MKKICFAILLLLTGFISNACGSEIPLEPMLRIETETGMHAGAINTMALSPDAKFFVTVSDDKTARVWHVVKGALLNVLRPPIGADEEGRLFAVAVSPDGETIAVAGCTGAAWDSKKISIYIFDCKTLSLQHRITDIPDHVLQLVYSKNNRLLVACLANGGIRAFRHEDYKLIASDTFNAASYGADFSNDGRLVVTCHDGLVRLYSPDLKLLARVEGPSGKKAGQAKFSPDGKKIAVGYFDSPAVDIFSGSSLAHESSLKNPAVDNGSLSCVSWSPDAKNIFAGGTYEKSGICQIVKFSMEQRGRAIFFNASTDRITQVIAMPGGNMLFSTALPSWGIYDASGKLMHNKGRLLPDYRSNTRGILINNDATRVAFNFVLRNNARASFSIRDRMLYGAAPLDNTVYPPKTLSPRILLTNWENASRPKLNGKRLAFDGHEIGQSFAIMPDDSGFVLASHVYLHFYDAAGREKWRKPAWGSPWSVNIAKNGKILAAAFQDGTIRWYRVSDGNEILALLPYMLQDKWILWTPSGCYDTSIGGEKLLGWHVNRGKDRESDFYTISRFREKKYRPDVIARALAFLGEENIPDMAETAKNAVQARAEIRQSLPPTVKIISPTDYSAVSSSQVAITFLTGAEEPAPIKKITAYIDGKPLPANRDLIYQPAASATLGHLSQNSIARRVVINIPPKNVRISLIAENTNGHSDTSIINLVWDGQPGPKEAIPQDLYLLAVGVNNYADAGIQGLKYAAIDARTFAGTMSQQAASKSGLYANVHFKVLINEKATGGNISEGLKWLRDSARENDTAMLFLAGHGVSQKNVYYFVPSDAKYIQSSGSRRLDENSLVHFKEIKETFNAIAMRGKGVFFIDTCHAGNVLGDRTPGLMDITGSINDISSDESGAVVYAASKGNQVSIEDDRWGHGAFTKILIEGINGNADYAHTGYVSNLYLGGYLANNVKKLTEGQQIPVIAIPHTIEDFNISKIKQVNSRL